MEGCAQFSVHRPVWCGRRALRSCDFSQGELFFISIPRAASRGNGAPAPAEPCQSKSGRAPSHTKHRPPEAVQPATQIPTGRVREVTIGEFVVFARQQAIDETKTLLRTFAMATATARLNTNQPVRLGLTHSTPSGSAVSRSGQAPFDSFRLRRQSLRAGSIRLLPAPPSVAQGRLQTRWLPSRLIPHRHRPRGELQPAHELQVDMLR